jgi:N-terminal acetyltransferase B complex non-catalytic subunit
MRAYDNLALKQIQLDTLSYIMFDGISSFHPHEFGQLGETQLKPPLEILKKQQKMIRGAPGQISRNTWLSYKHGSYNTVSELREVSDTLECTLASVMSVIEATRINRLIPSKEPTNGGVDILRKRPIMSHPEHATNSYEATSFDSINSKMSDTSDYATFPNFETTFGESFDELSRNRPGPNASVELRFKDRHG